MFESNDNDADDLVIQDVGSAAYKIQTAPPLRQGTETTAAPSKPAFELVDGLNECSNSEYHSDRKYLSSSVLKTVLESLQKYHNDYILGLKAEHSQSTQSNFDVGTLIHSMILEPETVNSSFNLFKGMRKAGKEYEDFLKTLKDPSLPCISINQHKTASDMFDAFKRHSVAKALIRNGYAEQTICGTLHGVPIKTRFDWINVEEGYIADVKSTGYGSDLESFKQTCDSFKYPLSGALYTAMAEAYYGKPFKFYYIVLSKKDKTCDVYVTSQRTMAAGKAKVAEACAKYLKAKATNNWTDDVLQGTISTSSTQAQEVPYIIQEV
jgi:hypothetical protein